MQTIKQNDFAQLQVESSSLRELILGLRNWGSYLLSKWYIIVLFGCIGGVIGLTYAWKQKPAYLATTSFVLETGNKPGGLGMYSGLASSFGIDLSGGGGGLFEGENILELYRSRNMISKTLLSESTFDNKRQLLVERYIEYNKLRNNWNEKSELKNIQFKADGIYANPKTQLLHDSIMGQIVKDIAGNMMKAERKDKKLSIITVSVKSPDELFAKEFNEKIVQNVNQFYLNTKRQKNLENVDILQIKTDSVRRMMTGAINTAAVVADATPNQNPTRMAQREAPIQNAKVSAEINQQVLSTLLQNLELSKISLLKETPLIQIVDKPILPLDKISIGKLKGLFIGGLISGFISLLFLSIMKIVRDNI
jgi:hypothetical protein